MNTKGYFISAILAGVLVGCGGSNSSDSSKDDTHTQDGYTVPTIVKSTQDFNVSMQSDVDALEQAGWVDASHSSIRALAYNGSKLVAGSKWHNALSVIDMTSKSSKYNSFAVLKDSGDGIKSPTTGASEVYIRGLEVLKSGDIIVNIPRYKETSDKKKSGLFKTKINSDGTVQTVSESKRISEPFSQFAVSGDEKTIVAYSSDNSNLVKYDADLEETAALEIAGLSLFAFADNSTLYGVITDKDTKKISISKITLSGDSIVVGTDKIPLEKSANFIKYNNGKLILVSSKGDITEVDLKKKTSKTTRTGLSVRSIDVSPNGKFLAVGGGEELNVLSLGSQYKTVQLQGTAGYYVYGLVFLDDTKLAYQNNRNGVAVLNINDTNKPIPASIIIERYVKGIEKKMNNGYPVDVIANDLALEKSMNDVTFTWTSSKPSVLSSDGKINRQDTDEAIKLSLVGMKKGSKDVYKKDYDIIVKAKLPKFPSASIRRLPGDADHRPNYMSANKNGSMAVSPVTITIDKSKRKYITKMSSYKVNANGKFEEVSKEKLYGGDGMELIGTGLKGLFAIGIEKKMDKKEPKQKMYEGKIYSVAIDENGRLADTVTKSLNIAGKPLGIEWNSKKTMAVVMVEKPDETFVSEIYKLDDNGNLTLDHTINMGDKKYSSWGPPAMNENGTRVYQRNWGTLWAVKNDGTIIEKEVEDVGRVWAGAGRVFANTYYGLIYSFNEDLEDVKIYNTGTYSYMYSGEVRAIDGKNYYFTSMLKNRNSHESVTGVYKYEIQQDGSLKGVAYNSLSDDNVTRGADRMTVSGDGKIIVYASTTRN